MSTKVKKTVLIALLIVVSTAVGTEAQVKQADLAGSWYSSSKEALRNELNRYIDGVGPVAVDGKVIAIITPHAGYRFSGPVAAYGFKLIQGMAVDTVVVIGFSHRRYYDGVAVLEAEGFQTPLGTVVIDQEMTRRLIRQHKKIFPYPVAFKDENSVEMVIPFLQVALGDVQVVLLAIGEQSVENYQILAGALRAVLKDYDNFLLVGSTDMCHYLPYEKANVTDTQTISLIEEFDSDKLYTESLLQGHRLMCGYGALCATMRAARSLGADKVEVLKYANSGDTAGDKRNVVGYLSAVMYAERLKPKTQEPKKGETSMLTEEQKKRLLEIARKSMETYIKTGKKMEVEEDDPVLHREMGAFVTLHHQGQLRGCIGSIIGKGPLCLTVRDMAIQSSTADPRFPPVTAHELRDIDLEVSVLSELEKVDDPETIEMGKHGVLVRSGYRSGVFLPQVATETGWSREEFMSNLCSHKAGLPRDAWKMDMCEIYVFTAEVFGEKK
jgi:AmmeMemoRadiSam system protein B/AmmeMemoRadiSam system protein A